jgi:hypothetical protein
MRKSKKYVYIDEPLYHYVCLETSLSNSGWNSKDIRGIDQLWLVKNIVEHSKEMGVENTASIYPTILNELGKFLFYRTKNLPMELRHAVFVQAAFLTDFFRVNGMDKELNNSSHKKLNKAFSNRDFSLWEIESSI